ncbi:hypothetical protein GXW74_21060 [Roseomonas eburnea]|uniref:Uncharacterized protein n=1 Tax=Neoroseomonas eburnea TaxID=1346889 RepID=A0A9X9XH09_9PROT|nr:hypothetical protein [Neoroseomonas eburnea]MBR0682995.1 hypothetical protein [Neoroseomonas eburnea]
MAGQGQGSILAALACAVCVLLVPPLLVPLPPLVDYPNHLARLWLIAGHAERPPLDAIYVIDWSRAVTNIGIDLLALGLGRVIGADTVGRLGVVLALLLPVLGTLALGRAVAGRWHAAMLLAPALAWNLPFAAGFLNHQISVGLALLAAAMSAALPGRPVLRAILLFLAGLVIIVVHLFGGLLLIALVAALAIGETIPARGARSLAVRRIAVAAAPPALALATFLLLAPTLPGEAGESAVPRWFWTWRPDMKAGAALAPFVTYHVLLGQAVALLLLFLAHAAVRRGWIRFHAGLCALAVGLFLGSLVLPSSLGDTEQIELRLSCAAVLVAIASLRPGSAMPRRARQSATAGLLAITFVLSGWVLHDWRLAARDVAAVERALAALPRGAAVLPAEAGDDTRSSAAQSPRLAGSWPLHSHYGLLAVMLRDAAVPGLFALAGKQPVRLRDAWRHLAPTGSSLPRIQDLDSTQAGATGNGPPRDWRENFGYLLVLDAAGADVAPPPAGLELLADEGFARLYRVVPR